jgi:cytochrome P450 family 142 subfamily A polypeptide 1
VSTTSNRLQVDLLDPFLYQSNPHDVWAWMRAYEPVYRDEKNGLWGITRHADVMDVERRSSVFSSNGVYRAVLSPGESNMIAQDDPRHRQQRMLVQPQLTRAGVSQRTEEIRQLVAELVDEVIERGECDIVTTLSGQLPARLTSRLLGFPEEMWPQVKSWSERLMRTDMRDRDPAVMEEFIAANQEFVGAMIPILKEVSGCPRHDFMSIWAHAQIDGQPLPPESIVHEVGLFIAGGAETTRTAISHGLRVFSDHLDQWNAMAAHPDLVPSAVEEVLRWVTPLNNFFRMALTDDVVGGQPIAAGERVVMLYPSANRDESVFTDPYTFDITRSPNPHLSFGFGTHLCVGANLARLVLETVFAEMSSRIAVIEPVTEPDVEANIFARAVKSFTVKVTPR